MPDKVWTQKTVTASEIDRLTIEVVAGAPTLAATYHVVDSMAVQIGHQRQVSIELTPAQVTTLKAIVTNIAVPAANAAERT